MGVVPPDGLAVMEVNNQMTIRTTTITVNERTHLVPPHLMTPNYMVSRVAGDLPAAMMVAGAEVVVVAVPLREVVVVVAILRAGVVAVTMILTATTMEEHTVVHVLAMRTIVLVTLSQAWIQISIPLTSMDG